MSKAIKVREIHSDEGSNFYYVTFFTSWRKAKAYARLARSRGWDVSIVRGSERSN